MTDAAHNSRRLLLLFLATTLVPAVCLCWLGWKVVEEDLVHQRNRMQEQREQAADLAASALQRVLAEVEERLASFSAAPATGGRDLAGGVALMAFGRAGLLEHAGTPLPYYPDLSKVLAPDPARFAAADELEFQKNDLTGALRALDAAAKARSLSQPARLFCGSHGFRENWGTFPRRSMRSPNSAGSMTCVWQVCRQRWWLVRDER
jgi:hypothetical protein